MPSLALDFHELDAEEVLVDLEDGGNNLGDGEVLLYKRVVEAQALLDELAVVVPVIPEVELAVERQALLVVLLLLERQEGVAVLDADGTKLLLEICEELSRGAEVSMVDRRIVWSRCTSFTLFAFLTIFTSVT